MPPLALPLAAVPAPNLSAKDQDNTSDNRQGEKQYGKLGGKRHHIEIGSNLDFPIKSGRSRAPYI